MASACLTTGNYGRYSKLSSGPRRTALHRIGKISNDFATHGVATSGVERVDENRLIPTLIRVLQ